MLQIHYAAVTVRARVFYAGQFCVFKVTMDSRFGGVAALQAMPYKSCRIFAV